MTLPLEKIRERYYEHTKQASELTRTLAISGIAAIWVFRESVDGGYKFDDASLVAGVSFCLSLLADLLHYVVGATLYRKFTRKKEGEGVKETSVPTRISNTIMWFWRAKVGLLVVGFVALAWGLAARVVAH
jgi:hypothetical protein